MSIIFFRFFLLFSVVANRVGPKARCHLACSRRLTGWVLSCSLRFAAKILYEIMLVRLFCNFSFFFTQFFWLMGWVWELFWRFLRFQLLFSRIFFGFWVGFGSCFGNFCGFSYFFLDFFRLLGLILGAVLGISAVSATFFWIFFGFWVDFGSCFKSFMDYSSTRACLLCYQPMAIVHYANLVLLNKYTFWLKVVTRAPGTSGAHVLSCRRIAKQFRYC